MRVLKIYTDGSCFPNPGRGGWAFVVVENDQKISQHVGGESHTTNNRMEYMALIQAIELYADHGRLIIHTDSMLLVNTYNRWIGAWANRDWMRREDGELVEIKNVDLVKRIYELKKLHKSKIAVHWIKGHAGNKWNEMADVMAVNAKNAQPYVYRPKPEKPKPEFKPVVKLRRRSSHVENNS